MKRELLPLLACPRCHRRLTLVEAQRLDEARTEVWEGTLGCEGCKERTPIVRGIPRFCQSDAYSASFSFEWTRFSTTQLDGTQGWKLSEERFRQSWDEPIEALEGKLILDAGCGMGRFAEVVAKHGGTVIGIDMSDAVDAAAKNLKPLSHVHLIQADLNRLPLQPHLFDRIYSLGVLHHLPDPRKGFEALLEYLKPGGKISVTLYSRYNKVYVASTTWWRRITTRLPLRWVYALSHLAIPLYHLYRIPVLGLIGQAIWPISMHPDPEWRVLDTFDCYTPRFQFYFTYPEVYRWFREAHLTNIAVLEPGISFIGTKPLVDEPVKLETVFHG